MPQGVTDANAVTTAFFQGRTGMMVLSTGSLSFVRDNMKTPYRVAFLPRSLVNAAPIGGASLIMPKGNTPERAGGGVDADQMADQPGDRRRLEPLHRLFRAAHRRLRPAGDEGIIWRSTPTPRSRSTSWPTRAAGSPPTTPSPCARRWRTGCRRCCPARRRPEAAMAAAQKQADELMRPYVEQTALKLPE